MCKVMTKMERKFKFLKDYINTHKKHKKNIYSNKPYIRIYDKYCKFWDEELNCDEYIHIGTFGYIGNNEDDISLLSYKCNFVVLEEFEICNRNIIDIIKLYNYIEFKYGYISFY